MRAALFAALVGLALAHAQSGSPAMERFLQETRLLEERIPGYAGTYYDRERKAYVVRIVPGLNTELKRTLHNRANAVLFGSQLRLPKQLALEYTQILFELRLADVHDTERPVLFEAGKYTWSQHYTWWKKIYDFWSSPRSMAPYGYDQWPKGCILSSFGRDVKQDRSYVFVLKDRCGDTFLQDFLKAINEQLGIPADAIGFIYLDKPMQLLSTPSPNTP